MIVFILTSPLTWISISIVAVCIVGIDFTIRPIWDEAMAAADKQL